jgi:hypothetical protein
MRDDSMTVRHHRLFRSLTPARFGRACALALGVIAAAGVAAQTPASAGKPVKPAARKPVAPVDKPALEARAVDLIKATSARLAAARSMSFTATVSYEYPSRLGPAIVYTSRYDVTMQRPDRLRVINPGDGPASEFYLDGKAMVAFAPAENLVAVAEAPPTIEAALKQAFEKAAIFFPFTDLLLPDPYAALADGTKLAFYIGPSGLVSGVKTDMVAWANDDVFVQMWIGADDKLPRRIRAVYRADPLRLRHDMELSNWQLDPAVAADAFGSPKTQSAQRMEFAHPVGAPPPGVKPVAKALKSTTKPQ